MSLQYVNLDKAILTAVARGSHPLYAIECVNEAGRIAEATGRESFRVIDCRIQHLRKKGLIWHATKQTGGGSGGWKIARKT